MAPGELRQPRLRVFVNNTEIANVIAGEVVLPDSFRAGRFRFSVAVATAPSAWWAAPPLLTELFLTLDGVDYAMITGYVDDTRYDAIRGIIELTGRDLAALPIGQLTPGCYENQAAGEIAATLAAQYGFSLNIQGDDGLFGRFFQGGTTTAVFTGYHNVQSDWDLLCGLARDQGCALWMRERVINIAPLQPGAPVCSLTPADCVALQCGHRLDLAAGIEVVVQSWDSWGEAMVSQSSASGSAAIGGRRMSVTMPNLSQDSALALATRLQQSLADHLLTVEIVMPGEMTLGPRATFFLSGTNSQFDGLYMVQELTRSISARHGFQQIVQAGAVAWTL